MPNHTDRSLSSGAILAMGRGAGLYPSTLSPGPWPGWFFCPEKKLMKGYSLLLTQSYFLRQSERPEKLINLISACLNK